MISSSLKCILFSALASGASSAPLDSSSPLTGVLDLSKIGLPLLDVNFICERGPEGSFVESDCGRDGNNQGIIADILISTALSTCVGGVTGQILTFDRPDYNDAANRALRRKQVSTASFKTISMDKCKNCPCDSRECCDLGYCTGTNCCRNCSCKRRELLLGNLLKTVDKTLETVGNTVDTVGQTLDNTLDSTLGGSLGLGTLDLGGTLGGVVDITVDLLETVVEETCTIAVRLVADLLLSLADNKCLGTDPRAVQCHAKILGL